MHTVYSVGRESERERRKMTERRANLCWVHKTHIGQISKEHLVIGALCVCYVAL